MSYPADRKVTVMKVVQEVTGLKIKEPKDLIERPLPTFVRDFPSHAEAEAAVQKFTEEGAVTEVWPEDAEAPVSYKSIAPALNLVHVAIAAFGESRDPDCEPPAIIEVVSLAQSRLEEWLSGCSLARVSHDRTMPVYDAIDLLTLAQHALQSESPPTTRYPESPIGGTMKVAAQLLAQVVSPHPSQEAQS